MKSNLQSNTAIFYSIGPWLSAVCSYSTNKAIHEYKKRTGKCDARKLLKIYYLTLVNTAYLQVLTVSLAAEVLWYIAL
jgi:hypothetical protein